MTEAEWLKCDDPQVMLYAPKLHSSDRKLRLLATSFARRASRYFPTFAGETFFVQLERHCEGLLSVAELTELDSQVWEVRKVAGADGVLYAAWEAILNAVECVPLYAAQSAANQLVWARIEELAITTPHVYAAGVPVDECPIQCNLIRCIIGNPFRPVTLDPAWRTSTVLALAQGIYDDRAFDRLPILADALQDAGCENAAVLNHCRDSGPHARGCWVVDLVLGKE